MSTEQRHQFLPPLRTIILIVDAEISCTETNRYTYVYIYIYYKYILFPCEIIYVAGKHENMYIDKQ